MDEGKSDQLMEIIGETVRFNDRYGLNYIDDDGYILLKGILLTFYNSNEIDLNGLNSLTKIYQHYLNNKAKIIALNNIEPRTIAQKYIGSPSVRNTVFALHGKRCLKCGALDRITLDHVVPIYHGGLNEIENLQPLCFSCNSKKRTNIIDYRTERRYAL